MAGPLLLAVLGKGLIDKFVGIIEREAGYLIATHLILPEYEKLTLPEIVKKFVKDKEAQDKLIELFRKDPGMRRTSDFIDFLKDFNLTIAKKSLQMGVISPTWGHQVSQLLNAVSWSFGFGWLSWVGLSPILNKIIAEPASNALDVTFPNRDITKAEAEKLYELGYYDQDGLQRKLKEMGYRDEAIKLILEKIKLESQKKEKDLSKSDILRAFKKGIITESDARAKLMELGYSTEEVDLLIRIYTVNRDVQKKEKKRDLTTSQVLRAYRLNLIERYEAERMLDKLGYDKEEIKILLDAEDLRKNVDKHEKHRDLTATQIAKAFLLGLISFEEAKDRLKHIGYDEDEAELLLSIYYLQHKSKDEGKD